MREPSEAVQKLQKETIYKEQVLLAQYSGLLGFSGACLLSVLNSGINSPGITWAFCFFITAVFCYTPIVLGRVFVLHKGMSLHIGHVIIAEDSSGFTFVIGGLSLVLGLATFSMQFSVWCAPFVIACAVLAFLHHIRFKRKFDVMIDARDIPEPKK